MALPDIDGIRFKLQRAYQQIDTLKEEIHAFLGSDSYGIALDMRRKRGATEAPCVMDFTIRVIVKKPCLPMWGVIIGEIVHDLRSALDQLVYQLVIHATNNPPSDDSRTQFPICDSPPKFKKSRLNMLRGVSSQATALIESLQPFSTGEGAKSPLWHVNQLSNIDKHRVLHLTGGTMEAFNFSFPPVLNPGRIEKRIGERGAFEHNAIVAEGRLYSDLPMFADQVKVDVQVTFNVVFDKRTPLVADWEVINTLLDAADRTRDCIAKISRDVLSMEFIL